MRDIDKVSENLDKEKDKGSALEDDGPQDQVFYDAFDELDDFQDPPVPIIVELRNEKDIHVPIFSPKQEKMHREDNTKRGPRDKDTCFNTMEKMIT